jgi:NAD(P)-dependent dehydrogenase (short-subunit alcohol dehydrogenase family)
MGREIARGLAKEGASVALVARTESALQELAEELGGLGGRGVAIATDVSDRQQVKDAVAKAREELGEIHVLINSAGVLDNEPIAGHSDDVWEYHYGVNVNSYFFKGTQFYDPLERNTVEADCGEPLVDQLFQGINADTQVQLQKLLGDFVITCRCFDPFRHHRLVGHKQQRACGNFVVKTGDEDRGGFHVNRHAADLAQIFFEFVIVFPDAAIGRVNRARPVIALVIADRGRDRLLQTERRQCRNFRRIIIVRGALAAIARLARAQNLPPGQRQLLRSLGSAPTSWKNVLVPED